MDFLTPDERSVAMAKVRGKDTTPEMTVRRAIWRLGYRYRLHPAELPGRPDIVLPRHRLTIFVHGCFWHRHEGCRRATWPKSNTAFWADKFATNIARDRRKEAALAAAGWRVFTIWECETLSVERLHTRLAEIMPPRRGDRRVRHHE